MNVSVLDFLRLYKKIIANLYKIHFRKRKMYNVIRYRYKNKKLKSIIIYLIELFELHENNIDIIFVFVWVRHDQEQ